MPEFLEKYLKRLDESEATELYDWLDDNPYVAEEMSDVLSASHPTLD